MKKSNNFSEFLERGTAKKVSPDKNRALSFIIKAKRKKSSIDERMEKLGLTDENAEEYIESSYDVIMLLIRAKMLTDGFKASGYGAHEVEISYLNNLGFLEAEVQFADRLRYFRNGMLYYGTELDKEYAQKVLDFLNSVYSKLNELLSE